MCYVDYTNRIIIIIIITIIIIIIIIIIIFFWPRYSIPEERKKLRYAI